MQVGSYNCRGLRLGKSEGDRSRRIVVDNLLQHCDILCLQETFLPKQDLGKLNCFNDNFHGAGESTTDLSLGIVRGRIAGGVAILWHKKLDSVINVIRLEVDWCIAVRIQMHNKEFSILNVYTLYESQQNEDEYLNRLAFINYFISDNHSTSVLVVDDMNADLTDKRSLFAKHMLQFCDDNNLIVSSQMFLPADSYSYISEAWHTTSWLDHCISTADAHESIRSIKIVYEASMSDHIPFVMSLDCESLPEMTQEGKNACKAKLDWAKLTNEDILTYYGKTDVLLSDVYLPRDAIMCSDVNCNVMSHRKDLCVMYNDIVEAMYEASRSYHNYSKRGKSDTKPGWKKHVAAHHAEAKEAYKAWVQEGRPRQGPVLDYKKLTLSKFKYAVRYISKNEQVMRADSLAEKLLSKNVVEFWKEVRTLNRSNTLLTSTVDGVSGADKIADLWKQNYSALFNCVKSDPYTVGNISNRDAVGITTHEVFEAITKLSVNKASGSDQITAEHLRFASPKVAALLAICFTGFMTHGLLPDSMLAVTLVPVIKNKAGKIGSMDNYRPIALASVISKVLESILLDRLGNYINTRDNQFGFKPKHGTELCIYSLKEIVEMYRGQNSSVLIGVIDASKAFDRVNHQKLFTKLNQRGVPASIIRILAYWYANQSMQVRWGSSVSGPFSVGNGVRQGGLLSPALFNLYMNDLSDQLNDCSTGCMIGNTVINHLMYADDLAIFSPSSAGFQQLLNVCTEYGVKNDVQYNSN